MRLKEDVEKTIMKEQEDKDQAKESQETSDELIADSSLNSDLDAPDDNPDLLIDISREAPSPLTARAYRVHMENLSSISLFVEQVVDDIVKRGSSNKACTVIQRDAIERSRVYLQDLSDISERVMKAGGVIQQGSTFRNRDGLLKSLLEMNKFSTLGRSAVQKKQNRRRKGRKGRKGLVASKEILDDQKKKLHRTTILEENEEEEENDDDEEKR
ncbi:hypothetical protein BASA81_013046 [Batrachochytrium salamandrivorans]|nr:hypothetical protein BASA81_013046 [Batrachochytrium salamandrivorans]